MENLPVYVAVVFSLTTLLTIWLFYKASHNSTATIAILLGWLIVQTFIGRSGFYTNTDTLPPRFLLMIFPPLLFIIGLFITKSGKNYIESLDIKWLTLLHIVRIPVEIVLLWLYINNAIPELMTFEGRNFDIFSGLSAPVIYYFGFVKKKLGNNIILAWNFLCLALLFNIVIHAILSAPTPFQRFAFDQPNIGILYFPFVWLPSIIVPLVFLSHLASIMQLLQNRNGKAISQ